MKNRKVYLKNKDKYLSDIDDENYRKISFDKWSNFYST